MSYVRRAGTAVSRRSRLAGSGVAVAALTAACLTAAPSAGAGGYKEEWGTGGESPCVKKLAPVEAYANTRSHDKWTNEINKFTVHESKNRAEFLECKTDKPVPLAKIEGRNTYTFSGPKLDKVTPAVSVPLTLPLTGPTVGLAAEFIGDRYVVTDEDPASCTDCYKLDFDQYNVTVSWQASVVTHYQHEATATYTGYKGDRIKTTSKIDTTC